MAANPTFSFSRVTTFEQCARRYRYRYLDGVKEGFQGVEGFMGSTVHSAIEWLFEQRDRGGDPPSLEQTVAWYCKHWDETVVDRGAPVRVIKSGIELETYRRSGAEMLSRFYRERFVPDRLVTLENEKHFRMTVDGGFGFQGFIDRFAVDESGLHYVIDYKTGSRVPKKFEGKEAEQLECYAMAIFAESELDEVELVLDFLKNGTRLAKRVHRSDRDRIEKGIGSRISEALAATVFPASPGVLCDWCGYNDLCDSARSRYGWVPSGRQAAARASA